MNRFIVHHLPFIASLIPFLCTCSDQESEMEIDAPGSLLQLHYVDLELDSAEKAAVTGGQEHHSEDHCSFEPVRSGSELREFTVAIEKSSAHKGAESTLLSVNVSNIESPDCNLSARQLGPQSIMKIGDLVRSSVTVEIGYSCRQNVQGTYQIEVGSNGQIVAPDGRCAPVSESLSETPVSF